MQALEQQGISPDSNDLIRHNMVVFQDGEAALQVWLNQLLDMSVSCITIMSLWLACSRWLRLQLPGHVWCSGVLARSA